ncbi:MAG: hypothetical protein H7834_15690 [Magnetococcus sp. YQC-9]
MSLHTLQSDHLDEASRLLEKFRQPRPKEFWLERFRFWWERNPAYREGMTRGWFVRDPNGTMIAFYAAIPLSFQIHGQKRLTWTGSTMYVESAHRGWGALLLLTLIKQCTDTICWLSTPGPQSDGMFTGLKLPKIPYAAQTKHILFTGPGGMVAQSLARTSGIFPHSGKVRRFLSWFDRLTLNDDEIRLFTQCDDSFDRLWDKSRHQYPTTRWRDRETLQWFCFGWNNFEKFLLGHDPHQNGQLHGYAVFQTRNTPQGRFLVCEDLWFDRNSTATPAHLLTGALKLASQKWLDGVIVFNYPGLESWLKRFAYQEVQSESPPGYFKVPSALAHLESGTDTLFMLGEGDSAL